MSIKLEQVSKSYGDDRSAVVDVSVDIADGEFFVLLGPSGSGKSTLLRAIAGLSNIDHGRIVLHGRDVTGVPAGKREVGFVFQDYALFRHMTVADNIEFALRVRRVRPATRRERRRELLRLVALEGLDDRYPAQLSGGQQQRVAVARALAHEPRVLLLDEPFGALDAKIREELRQAVRHIQRTLHITAILVTHDQEEAFSMADRIGVMDRARLQEVGEPRSLYRKPATRFVATFLGAANLLLSHYENGGTRLGESRFQLDPPPRTFRNGDEATFVVRPEDIDLAESRDNLPTAPVGAGVVTEIRYSGATERIRVAIPAVTTLRSALDPTAAQLLLDVTRATGDASYFPIQRRQRVWAGCRNLHMLPTPVSSLRLLARTEDDSRALADAPLVRELGQRLQSAPVREITDAPQKSALHGLPVVSLRGGDDLDLLMLMLGAGARQVLAVPERQEPPKSMWVCTEPSSQARVAALAVASSLARHLTLDVTMLVGDSGRPRRSARYQELLDLRSVSLNDTGLDIRTETYDGSLADAMRSRGAAMEQVLLVAGFASSTGRSRLLRDLATVLMRAIPAALLVVSARSDQPSRVVPISAAYASAATR